MIRNVTTLGRVLKEARERGFMTAARNKKEYRTLYKNGHGGATSQKALSTYPMVYQSKVWIVYESEMMETPTFQQNLPSKDGLGSWILGIGRLSVPSNQLEEQGGDTLRQEKEQRISLPRLTTNEAMILSYEALNAYVCVCLFVCIFFFLLCWRACATFSKYFENMRFQSSRSYALLKFFFFFLPFSQ